MQTSAGVPAYLQNPFILPIRFVNVDAALGTSRNLARGLIDRHGIEDVDIVLIYSLQQMVWPVEDDNGVTGYIDLAIGEGFY